jgi:hypothetical protein
MQYIPNQPRSSLRDDICMAATFSAQHPLLQMDANAKLAEGGVDENKNDAASNEAIDC